MRVPEFFEDQTTRETLARLTEEFRKQGLEVERLRLEVERLREVLDRIAHGKMLEGSDAWIARAALAEEKE